MMPSPLSYSHAEKTERGTATLPLGDAISRANALAERAKQRTAQVPVQINQIAVQLPLWADAVRGVPNAVLRAALFGVITKGLKKGEAKGKERTRAYLERQEIHALAGIRIIYTGARLDQGDLDVWETVLHIARKQALGDECRVTAYQLLKTLGKTVTGKNYDTLNHRLSRMKATGIDVKVGKFSYEGSLIDEVYRAEETREYVIRLNPKLRNLFAADQFTRIDWTVRYELNGKPLAQWLHGFYSSHAEPYPYNISTLLKLSGNENTAPRSSRQNLRKALDALTEACNKNGQPFRYEIRGNLVLVEKTKVKKVGKS